MSCDWSTKLALKSCKLQHIVSHFITIRRKSRGGLKVVI